MKLIKLTLLILLAALFITACNRTAEQTATGTRTATPAPAAATPDEFAAARATFAKDCVNCHLAKGEGGPVTVDGHKLKVPSLREGHALKHPDSDFVEQITKGGDGMPGFKDKLKPEEIDGLVRFIRHEFQGKP
jgi:mono/diheme cytochrome c family protein